MSKKSRPILYSKLLYEMGQDFLDTQYYIGIEIYFRRSLLWSKHEGELEENLDYEANSVSCRSVAVTGQG